MTGPDRHSLRGALTGSVLAALLFTTPQAQAVMDEQTAVDHVQRMIKLGKPASSMLQYLIDDGRTLDEAVELTVSNALSAIGQVAFTRAALCSPSATGQTAETALSASGNAEEVLFVVERHDPRACNNMAEELPDFAGSSGDTPGSGGLDPDSVSPNN